MDGPAQLVVVVAGVRRNQTEGDPFRLSSSSKPSLTRACRADMMMATNRPDLPPTNDLSSHTQPGQACLTQMPNLGEETEVEDLTLNLLSP